MPMASSVSTYSETTYVTVTYLSKNTNCIAREEEHSNASNFLSLFQGCSATVDLFLLFLVRKWVCLFYFLHFVQFLFSLYTTHSPAMHQNPDMLRLHVITCGTIFWSYSQTCLRVTLHFQSC